MKFITFSGVDGSGKSTQLALLKEKLGREGKRVMYFHAVEFSLANKIARFFSGKKTFTPGQEKAVTRASFLSLIIREKFLFVDLLRFRLLLRRLKKENCDYLLSDRSFYDSLINLAYLSSAWHTRVNLRFLTPLIPAPNVAFYFDVDPSVIMARTNAPEQGLSYLQMKTLLFKEKITDWNLVVVDANRDKESIFQDICTRLKI